MYTKIDSEPVRYIQFSQKKLRVQEYIHLRDAVSEGPYIFQYLKTVEGRVYGNYKAACLVRGLLEKDEHWNAIQEEFAVMHSPQMLHDLCSVMLCNTKIFNEALIIEDKVRSLGGSALKSIGLPRVNQDSNAVDVLRERTCNVSELGRLLEEKEDNASRSKRNISEVKVQESAEIALTVASSDIAANLLTGGRTAH
ncbi:ATP-dependent DNA helicase [Trichonephila clavipes]|nr:ATP-dependent DNA helicase [Trichonephila clavipes]